jgi:hypothetical protein
MISAEGRCYGPPPTHAGVGLERLNGEPGFSRPKGAGNERSVLARLTRYQGRAAVNLLKTDRQRKVQGHLYCCSQRWGAQRSYRSHL